MPDKAFLILLIAGLLLATSSFAADEQRFGSIERGRYLATIGDCTGCHRNPETGQPFAGGLPIETPFGTVVAPNITPDWQTGIGSWTDHEFAAALRLGKRRDGANLYPAMPYPYFTKMTDEEVRDLRLFLATQPAVFHSVEVNKLPFPFSIREGMAAWNLLYFKHEAFKPSPEKSAEWNRGAYLVQGPGHCGACHTPKTFLGGDETSRRLQGSPVQGWFAPNLTSDSQLGIGTWSLGDIVAYLGTGHNRITAATGPMSEVVTFSTSKMSDDDLKAIATYLKEMPAGSSPAPSSPATGSAMSAGGAIYRDVCAACHGLDGKGVPELIPSLADSPSLRSPDPSSILRVVLRGARSVATARAPTASAMPAYGRQLDDAQIAAVITYVRNSWGSAAHALSSDDVRKARAGLDKRSN